MSTFSIITTTYKHKKFIWATIESILAQDFSDWELLIWDDSPDEDTWQIIESYTKKYPKKIRAWHHIPNKGIVENMNFLLSQVSPDSEYIAFLEGDDIYTPDCLEKKFQIFEKYPDIALVYSDMDFINAQGKITLKWLLQWQWVPMYQNEYISSETYILARNPLIVSYSSIAIRMSILTQLLPIQNLTWSKTYAVSDYDLIFRLIQYHRVYGIQESLTQYRRHMNNLSASYGGLFDDLLLLIEKYKNEEKISMMVYRDKISWIFILKSLSSLASGSKSESWKYLKESFQKSRKYAILYKWIICIFLMLPTSWAQVILQKRMRRGS